MKKTYTKPALELIEIKGAETITDDQLSAAAVQTTFKYASLTSMSSGFTVNY